MQRKASPPRTARTARTAHAARTTRSARTARLPTHRARLAGLAALLCLVLAAVGARTVPVIAAQLRTAAPASGQRAAAGPDAVTAADVVNAFVAAGLDVGDVQPQTVSTTSASGPPMTETEAVGFSIASIAPHGGRIMIFADQRGMGQKVAWFQRTGSDVITYHNALVWLDPDLTPTQVAAFRAALHAAG